MPSLEHRLSKLEEQAPGTDDLVEQFLSRLPSLDEHDKFNWETESEFFKAFAPWLAKNGGECRGYDQLSDPIERGLASLLFTFKDSADPFVFERYRDRVPDRVIAAIYSGMRNYAFKSEVALKIRILGEVMDQAGNVMPGYVLNETGCIVHAPAGDPKRHPSEVELTMSSGAGRCAGSE